MQNHADVSVFTRMTLMFSALIFAYTSAILLNLGAPKRCDLSQPAFHRSACLTSLHVPDYI